jgi:FlaA1/EpsC-like NDP-sugar epimerase
MGKVITITGGSGYIGSHLCKYLYKLQPIEIRVISNDILELSNFHELYPDIITHFCDIRNINDLNKVCKDTDILLHLAAFKYAPEAESFKNEVYSTNVEGTKNVFDVALANNVEKVLNISSDKAVNPLGFYAKTKRIGEILTDEYGHIENVETQFVNLRFGNVFNSTGSVVPLVLNQIRTKQPVTVTNPNMIRYYINMFDLSRFIIKSISIKTGGTSIPGMVKIQTGELIDTLISMSGKQVEKRIIGEKPGEKLEEEILNDFESFLPIDRESPYYCILNDRWGNHNLLMPLIHSDNIVKFIEISKVVI